MGLTNKHIVITGASFIGSHLVSALIKKNVKSIRIVNLTDRKKIHFNSHYPDVEFLTADLRDINKAKKHFKHMDIVIHLAADHGGRGYVDLRQSKTATNFILDGSVFKACLLNDVQTIFYASSGCVYPGYLQNNIKKKLYLKESDVKLPYDADNIYGWAKLMGELTLKQYYKDYKLHSSIGRFFTVYGPYALESHAIVGTIAKAFVRQEPFKIWGSGKQIRNWTYVDDIVRGIVLAIEHINNAAAVNLGTRERNTVDDMAELVFKYSGFYPKRIFHVNMPTGPLNRVADIRLAKKLLRWEPRFSLKQGLSETIKWYRANKSEDEIKKHLDKLLIGGKS